MPKQDDSEITIVAREIQRYLSAHPQAADSLEGVVSWWLPRQRLDEARTLVQQALDYLIAQGAIAKNTNRDGNIIYISRVHAEKH